MGFRNNRGILAKLKLLPLFVFPPKGAVFPAEPQMESEKN
jgi:hypothetical protein